MFWSPFISHHKPKLQINVQTQKWHCWVSNQGGHNLFQLFKKLKSYLTRKLANDEKSNEELKTIIIELERWGKDLKKRANYYDL